MARLRDSWPLTLTASTQKGNPSCPSLLLGNRITPHDDIFSVHTGRFKPTSRDDEPIARRLRGNEALHQINAHGTAADGETILGCAVPRQSPFHDAAE